MRIFLMRMLLIAYLAVDYLADVVAERFQYSVRLWPGALPNVVDVHLADVNLADVVTERFQYSVRLGPGAPPISFFFSGWSAQVFGRAKASFEILFLSVSCKTCTSWSSIVD